MKRLLTEANLTNFTDLLTSINAALDIKEIPQLAGTFSDLSLFRTTPLKKSFADSVPTLSESEN